MASALHFAAHEERSSDAVPVQAPNAPVGVASFFDSTAPGAAPAVEAELPPPDQEPLALSEVITAVYASYPALDAASRERQIAAGQQLAAMGAFDLNLAGEAIAQPLAYYKNYRYDVELNRYNWSGGRTFAGYRLGRGFFEPWYKERQTDEGGEFRVGFALPFLRDAAIDKRRAAVFQAEISQAAAEPFVQAEVIDTVRGATIAYWNWVAAGQRVEIARRVRKLAADRQVGMETRAQRGEIAEIELIDNQRLIVSRQAKLIEAELKLQQAAVTLSLFLRDGLGRPLLVSAAQLPPEFPRPPEFESESESELVAAALARRPELRLLALEAQRQDVEVQQASNLALPGFDGVLAASQDVGEPYSPKRDKSPFELQAGLLLDVPLQRREARGKLLEARGKLAQIAAKTRGTEQSITAEVQAANAAMEANRSALLQALQNVELARQLAEAERTKLARGDSDLLMVNLREVNMVEAELLVVEAEFNYVVAVAQLHAATAAELINSTTLQSQPPP
jgi:outer membrane protein TolC